MTATRPGDMRPTVHVRPEEPYRGSGWILFAGVLLMMGGVLNAFWGISAIGGSAFFDADATYILSNLDTWGWIVTALAVNDTLSFNDLKQLLGTTDGNLSVHARKLEEAAYVTCTKFFEGRTPKTEFRLTATGRRAFNEYLDRMEGLIRTSRQR